MAQRLEQEAAEQVAGVEKKLEDCSRVYPRPEYGRVSGILWEINDKPLPPESGPSPPKSHREWWVASPPHLPFPVGLGAERGDFRVRAGCER